MRKSYGRFVFLFSFSGIYSVWECIFGVHFALERLYLRRPRDGYMRIGSALVGHWVMRFFHEGAGFL